MGCGPFDNFESSSQQADAAADQTCEASLSSSLWQELGTKVSNYLAPETARADNTDAGTLDFSTNDIYSGGSDKSLDTHSDPNQFVPSERRDAHPNYRGEIILRDVEPVDYETSKETTLAEVARDHLGPGASQEEIDAHVREIAELNYATEDSVIPEKYPLSLPGHTHDGGFTTLDYHDNRRTVWRNGHELMERTDGSGYQRRPTSGSGYAETHWGPEPEDCYELVRAADGRYLVSDDPGAPPVEKPDHDDLRVERARLSDLIKSLADSPRQVDDFRFQMRNFEARAERQEVKPIEVAQTYHQLSRLVEAQGTTVLDKEQRKALARQVIEQAVDPTSIDQGSHNTCNVTTVESRMYTRHPSHAAKLVTDMALTGQFETQDKTVIQVNPDSLQPRTESKLDGRYDGERSYASQIFQVAAANVYWQRQLQNANGNEIDVRYEQVDPEGDADTGERLRDHWGESPVELTNTDGTLLREPYLDVEQMHEIYREISGKSDKSPFLAHASQDQAVPKFEDELQLRARLIDLKNSNQLPAVIKVDAANEPFLTDSNDGKEGGSGEWHVVTVTDIDPDTDLVSVDNQWGSDADKLDSYAIPLEELYLSTWKSTAPSHIDAAAESADDQLKLGKDEHFAELDVLRLQHDADLAGLEPLAKWARDNAGSTFAGLANLSVAVARLEADYRYDTALAEKIVEIEKRSDVQESAGSVDEAAAARVDAKLRDMVLSMPEDRQAKIASLVQAGLSDWTYTAPLDPVTAAAERRLWWSQLRPEN